MICPKCHTVNDDEEKYCRECGFQLNSARICPTCGKTNDSNSKYCKECGTVLTPVNTFRKQVIEENNQKSFFSLYKIPIICALVIILAIGAVTGMAYYNGGSGGDDGFSSIIPTDDNGFLNDNVNNDPTQAQMQAENRTNDTSNQTNDTNSSKKLTEKVENKTNQTKNISSTENKIKNQTNSSKSSDSSASKNDSSKTITEKVNNDKDKSDKNAISDSSKDNSGSSILIPGFSNDDSDDINDVEDNDSDDNDSSDLDDDSDSSLNQIEMDQVPNLAQKVSQSNYAFSTIEYEGQEFDEAQCIYIFSEYLLKIDKNDDSPIEIKDVKNASNPSGKDLNQSIEKEDYLSMAQRAHSWMDQKDTVPNYIGISGIGEADLSPKKMLKLFTLATLEYSISEELPESVEI